MYSQGRCILVFNQELEKFIKIFAYPIKILERFLKSFYLLILGPID